jgi:uncharacterized membrane protein (UPF0127 family)
MSLFHFKSKAVMSRLKRQSAETAKPVIKVVNLTRQVEIADRVQLAGDGRSRRKGLLGREDLAGGEGLWIVPCEAVHTFWMRFPIDLVYLDRKHRVVKVRTHVGPWRMSTCLRAHSVIELGAGTIGETGTTRGDILQLMSDGLFL